MAKVEIYTSPFCAYCYRAKKLLEEKGVEFTEINLMLNPGRRREMLERAHGSQTVPQIFIDDRHVGDCDELYRLERERALDTLLGLGAGTERATG